MDSRSKILTLEQALALDPPRPLTLVSGLFDLLRAAHVRALQDVRSRTGAATLLSVVLPHPAEVLSQRSRAEMAAALRVLDYVVTAHEADFQHLADALRPSAVVRLEEADCGRVRELIAHVHSRQAR